jgi:hypothetical protein
MLQQGLASEHIGPLLLCPPPQLIRMFPLLQCMSFDMSLVALKGVREHL